MSVKGTMKLLCLVVMMVMIMTRSCNGGKVRPKPTNDRSDESESDSRSDESDETHPEENLPPGPSSPSPSWFLFLKIFLKDLPPTTPAYEQLFHAAQKNVELGLDGGILQLDVVEVGTKMAFINNIDYLREAFQQDIFLNTDVKSNLINVPLQMAGTIRNNGSAHKEIHDFAKLTILNSEFMEETAAPRIDEAILVLIDKLKESTGGVTVIEPLLGYSQDLFERIAFDDPGSYDLTPGSFGSNLSITTYQLFQPSLSAPSPGNTVELRGVASYLQDRTSATPSNTNSLAGRMKDYLANLETPIARPEDTWRFMVDIFVAGRTNIAEGLAFVIYHLAEDQNLQDRIRQEINDLDTDVAYGDRSNLPHTMSFLYEILRVYPLVPIGLIHVATADGKIGGFDIKKNTRVLPNLYAIHNNPDDWKNPDVFNATRFLRWSGEHLSFDPMSVNASRVAAFSAGKRSCPGELMVRMTFFKTTLSLVRHFRITRTSESNFNIKDHFGTFFVKSREYQAVFESLL